MLNQLKKYLESERKDERIFDIIIYGSSVRGKNKPNDIDIAVVFLEGTLRERLEKIQKIKQKLKPLNKIVDIKQFVLKDFFSSSFLARTGILLEGISVFKDIKFSELLGFRPFSIFSYKLNGLNHLQKVKFNYILSGRNSDEGILKEFDGERLASGAIKIPIEKSDEFEEILKSNNIKYKRMNILEAV